MNQKAQTQNFLQVKQQDKDQFEPKHQASIYSDESVRPAQEARLMHYTPYPLQTVIYPCERMVTGYGLLFSPDLNNSQYLVDSRTASDWRRLLFTEFSNEPAPEVKTEEKKEKNGPISKNFLTNIGRCLQEYLREKKLHRREPFKCFLQSHHKTMRSFNQFLQSLTKQQVLLVEEFFQGKAIKYMLLSKMSPANIKEYIRMMPIMLYGLKTRQIPCLTSLREVLENSQFHTCLLNVERQNFRRVNLEIGRFYPAETVQLKMQLHRSQQAGAGFLAGALKKQHCFVVQKCSVFFGKVQAFSIKKHHSNFYNYQKFSCRIGSSRQTARPRLLDRLPGQQFFAASTRDWIYPQSQYLAINFPFTGFDERLPLGGKGNKIEKSDCASLPAQLI